MERGISSASPSGTAVEATIGGRFAECQPCGRPRAGCRETPVNETRLGLSALLRLRTAEWDRQAIPGVRGTAGREGAGMWRGKGRAGSQLCH